MGKKSKRVNWKKKHNVPRQNDVYSTEQSNVYSTVPTSGRFPCPLNKTHMELSKVVDPNGAIYVIQSYVVIPINMVDIIIYYINTNFNIPNLNYRNLRNDFWNSYSGNNIDIMAKVLSKYIILNNRYRC